MRELLLDWYDCNDSGPDVSSESSKHSHSSDLSALIDDGGEQPAYTRTAKSLPHEVLQVVEVMPDPRIASSARLSALKSGAYECCTVQYIRLRVPVYRTVFMRQNS